ncbi:MAG: archaeosortase/exosortase family protein, partial [Vicinamibacteria bacterium]
MAFSAGPALLVPVLLLAFWPVWRWYAARMTDGSDEPLGIVALLTACAFLPRRGWRDAIPAPRLIGVLAALVVYLLGFAMLPALVRGALAIAAIACALPRDAARPPWPLGALLLLSLPVIATLQFYLGFPLRVATTWCAAHLLALGGYDVVAHGTILQWAGEEVLVDAPCSGIRMLWTASYLSATLAACHRLPASGLFRLMQWTGAVVFA